MFWPAGRHSRYDPSLDPRLALSAASSGKTNEEISKELGIVVSTLGEWRRKHPEFSVALHNGRDYAVAILVDSLFNRAIGMTIKEIRTTYDREENVMGRPLMKILSFKMVQARQLRMT